jgi:hypothetical protein
MLLRLEARVSRDGFSVRRRRLAPSIYERPMADVHSSGDLHQRLPGRMPEDGSPNAQCGNAA